MPSAGRPCLRQAGPKPGKKKAKKRNPEKPESCVLCPLIWAVIIRKNSLSNRSENGMLMSVYRTLKLRGHNPIATIANALRTYVKTGTLPALPEAIVADG